MTPASSVPASDQRLSPEVWKTAAVASLGAFLTQLDATMVNVAVSTLVEDLNSPIAVLQWVVTGYLLALTLVLPLSGYLVGRIGAKAVYLSCFTGFAITSVLCGLAWSSSSLIAFRLLQGMSGGLLAPMAQMMIARAASSQMARVAGYAALPILLGPILGPIFAGSLLYYLSWRWIFFTTALVAVCAILLAAAFIPADRKEELQQQPMDWFGLMLLSPSLAFFVYSLNRISDAVGLLLFSGALLMLILFVVLARMKGNRALVDIGLFEHKPFRIAAITQFLMNGINLVIQILIPMFLILGCGRLPSETGWLMAPLGAGMMCAYPSMSSFIKRFGIRITASIGASLSLTATLLLALMSGIGFMPILLMPTLFILGVGQGAVGLSSMTAAYTTFSKSDLAMATAALNICQRLGGPILTTIATLFLAGRLEKEGSRLVPLGAFSSTFLLLSLVLMLCIIATLQLPRATGGYENRFRPKG